MKNGLKEAINHILEVHKNSDLSLLEVVLEYCEEHNIEPEVFGKELLDDTGFVDLLGIDCEQRGILRPKLFGLESRIPENKLDEWE